MASTQSYFSTMRNFYVRLTTGVTADDGSSATAATWLDTVSGGGGGTVPTTDWMLSAIKITDSSATGVGNIADSLLRVFITDPESGGSMRLIDTIDLNDPAASSNTAKGFNVLVPYGPLWTFGANAIISFNISVTPTAGQVDVFGFAQAA